MTVVEEPGTEREGSRKTGAASGQDPRANEKGTKSPRENFSLGIGLETPPDTHKHPDNPSQWGPIKSSKATGPNLLHPQEQASCPPQAGQAPPGGASTAKAVTGLG